MKIEPIGRGAGSGGEFGVFANVAKPDGTFRVGAKVQILYGSRDTSRAICRGVSIGGRVVNKYAPIGRLNNFRTGWLTENQRQTSFLGNREEMEQIAISLNNLVKREN